MQNRQTNKYSNLVKFREVSINENFTKNLLVLNTLYRPPRIFTKTAKRSSDKETKSIDCGMKNNSDLNPIPDNSSLCDTK